MNNQNTLRPDLSSPETKAKFFAQYIFQNILIASDYDPNTYSVQSYSLSLIRKGNMSTKLELTPLSDITDDDAKHCQLLQGYNNCDIVNIEPHFDLQDEFMVCFESNHNDNYEGVNINTIDFLRSRGYALPWMGYSVNELIEAGYLVLKKGGENA